MVSHYKANRPCFGPEPPGPSSGGLFTFEGNFVAGVLFDKLGLQIVHHHVVIKGRLHHVYQLLPVKVGPHSGFLSPGSHIVSALSALLGLVCFWFRYRSGKTIIAPFSFRVNRESKIFRKKCSIFVPNVLYYQRER